MMLHSRVSRKQMKKTAERYQRRCDHDMGKKVERQSFIVGTIVAPITGNSF